MLFFFKFLFIREKNIYHSFQKNIKGTVRKFLSYRSLLQNSNKDQGSWEPMGLMDELVKVLLMLLWYELVRVREPGTFYLLFLLCLYSALGSSRSFGFVDYAYFIIKDTIKVTFNIRLLNFVAVKFDHLNSHYFVHFI